jgi:hypothetical protein
MAHCSFRLAAQADKGFVRRMAAMTSQVVDGADVFFHGHLLKTPVAIGGLRVRFDGSRIQPGDWPGQEQ